MATIYAKTGTDNQLILGVREGYLRQFDFGTWTEMRIGLYAAGVLSSGDNTACATESVTVTTNADRGLIGLKNSNNTTLPGFAGSTFVGVGTEATDANYCNGTEFDTANGRVVADAWNGTTRIGGTYPTYVMGTGIKFPATITGSSAYNGFWGMKLTVANRGLSTQTITVATATTQNPGGTDFSASALRLLMNSATYTASGTALQWNSGGAALTIPDGIFIRFPFYNNRLRISALRAIRVS